MFVYVCTCIYYTDTVISLNDRVPVLSCLCTLKLSYTSEMFVYKQYRREYWMSKQIFCACDRIAIGLCEPIDLYALLYASLSFLIDFC